MEAVYWRGYFWGYISEGWGYIPKNPPARGYIALTDTEIRRSRPADKPYRLADSGGLYLQIAPTGGKLWRWKYRFEGKEKLMSLGHYPDVPLAEARERHVEARKLLASGIDPMAERKAEKTAKREAAANSFETVAL